MFELGKWTSDDTFKTGALTWARDISAAHGHFHFHMSGRPWNSCLPCGLHRRLELTLIHSNLAEEMREDITLYGKLLSRLHFICPSVPTASAHHALCYCSGTGRIFQHRKPRVTGSLLLKMTTTARQWHVIFFKYHTFNLALGPVHVNCADMGDVQLMCELSAFPSASCLNAR